VPSVRRVSHRQPGAL